nr:MAG TPA: hypothetical protein [Caudoviricetes sp.]
MFISTSYAEINQSLFHWVSLETLTSIWTKPFMSKVVNVSSIN